VFVYLIRLPIASVRAIVRRSLDHLGGTEPHLWGPIPIHSLPDFVRNRPTAADALQLDLEMEIEMVMVMEMELEA